MKQIITLTIACCILFFAACVKKPYKIPLVEPSLPEITTNGANTFGVEVNGKNWIPIKDIHLSYFYMPLLRVYYNSHTSFGLYRGRLNIDSYRYNPFEDAIEHIRLYSDTILTKGTYQFNNTIGNYVAIPHPNYFSVEMYNKDSVYKNSTYYLPKEGTNKLTITYLDTTKQIISGTFEVDMVDTISGKYLKMRKGRFDVKYE